MQTQRINFLEAMNFAMAGITVRTYNGFTMKLKSKKCYLAVYSSGITKGVKLDADIINLLKDQEWHAGDDKTIKGYYGESSSK